MTDLHCPSAEQLSAWIDEALDSDRAHVVRRHLDDCERCRTTVLDWMDACENLLEHPTCPNAEILVAYVEDGLSTGAAISIATHLERCHACAGEVREMRAIEAPEEVGELAHSRDPLRYGVIDGLRSLIKQTADWFQATPGFGVAAVAALALLVVFRVLPSGTRPTPRGTHPSDVVPLSGKAGPLQQGDRIPLGSRAASESAWNSMVSHNVSGRTGPGREKRVVATLVRGEAVRRLARAGDWVQVERKNGGIVWIPASVLGDKAGSADKAE